MNYAGHPEVLPCIAPQSAWVALEGKRRYAMWRVEVSNQTSSGEVVQLLAEHPAWTAHAEDQEERALEQMEAAETLEVATPKHPVTPAPTLPADELLGDLLMEQGKVEQALAAYKWALDLYPRRFNSLLGAARAARALEDEQAASVFYNELLKLSEKASNRSGLDEARAFLADQKK